MEINLTKIKVRDLVEGYADNGENGVVGYNGKLDIRPPYQREFIYKDAQRDAVITTINNKFPLNVMYWAVREDGTFEVLDGQQRTISICQYVNGDYSYDFKYFHNLTEDEKNVILDYELMVYICEGTDKEKLDWFKVINIAGEELSNQELRNAVYHGSWVADAKRYFSKNGCPGYKISQNYQNKSVERQELLELAIKWISKNDIVGYMAKHQHDPNAQALWMHFNSVITWAQTTFPKKRKELKSVDWGTLYSKYGTETIDIDELNKRVDKLMQDSDVEKKSGIYAYVLDGDENHLGIRAFDDNTKCTVYEKQQGICKLCGKHFEIEQMEADHITPWKEGGRTIEENCQMLCRECNRRKGAK